MHASRAHSTIRGLPLLTKEFVTMKGTRRGILVHIAEDCPLSEGLEELRSTIQEKRHFFAGSPVSLDLGWREMRDDEYDLLMNTLHGAQVRLLGVISSSQATRKLLESHGIKVIIGALGLAKHGGNTRLKATGSQGIVAPKAEREAIQPVKKASVVAPAPASVLSAVSTSQESTLVVRRTLRSGQRIQYAGNVVVLGDVNAGAEIEAEGDIVVVGNLRGVVHAGCRGKGDAIVIALNLHAAHLRIGNLVGMVNSQRSYFNNAAVMARLHEGAVATSLYGR